MEVSAAISLPCEPFRLAGQESERRPVGYIIAGGLAHVLDSDNLDGRSGAEEVHDFGQSSISYAYVAEDLRRSIRRAVGSGRFDAAVMG